MRINKLLCLIISVVSLFALAGCSIHQEKSANGDDKNVDIQTPVGSLHVGKDVDPRDAGLAVYPGATLKDTDDKGKGDDQSANLSILTSAFGLKVVAADYLSDDAPGKVAAFYKDQLKKYGSVLECHSDSWGHKMDVHSSHHDDDHAGPVSCESPNTGSVLELKVGTEDNQHVVSLKPQDKGTEFSLVYVRLRGKQGDI
jgi:hypothetical protein